MGNEELPKGLTCLELAQMVWDEEARNPSKFQDPGRETRMAILKHVPEARFEIARLERMNHEENVQNGSRFFVGVWQLVGVLTALLDSALNQGNVDQIARCLRAAEELLDDPDSYEFEVVEERVVGELESHYHLVRDMCGPRLLSLLEASLH